MKSLSTAVTAALVALALISTGCTDPAKGKVKAETSEAKKAAVAPADAVTFDIEPSTSKIEWVGSKVTAKHEGAFTSFKGTLSLVANDPEKSSVTVDVDANSLQTDPEKLTTHLKSADFFDVEKFPKVSFASTAIVKGSDKGGTHTVTGNFTLHGTTKSVTFPATIKTSPTSVAVNAEFVINRQDFGLVYPGKADDLIRDDVIIKLALNSASPAAN